MTRFLLSLLGGLLIGGLIGLYLGWVQFPVEYVNSTAPELAAQYQDEYTVMIASGYLSDGDAEGAIQRLRLLGYENVPAQVQDVTERYITNSGDVRDVYALVALAEGLGRLTPIMEPYRNIVSPGATPPGDTP